MASYQLPSLQQAGGGLTLREAVRLQQERAAALSAMAITPAESCGLTDRSPASAAGLDPWAASVGSLSGTPGAVQGMHPHGAFAALQQQPAAARTLEQQWVSAAAAHAEQQASAALGRHFTGGLLQQQQQQLHQHQQKYGLPDAGLQIGIARDPNASSQLPRISMAPQTHQLMLGGELVTNLSDFGYGSYSAQGQAGGGASLMSHPRMALAAQQQQHLQQQQQHQQQRPQAQSAPSASARRSKAEPRRSPSPEEEPQPKKRSPSPPVPVAAGRSRRANAGKRLARSYSDEDDSPPPRVPKAQRSGLGSGGGRHGGSAGGGPAGRVVRSVAPGRHTPGGGEPSAEDLEAIDALHALIGGNQ